MFFLFNHTLKAMGRLFQVFTISFIFLFSVQQSFANPNQTGQNGEGQTQGGSSNPSTSGEGNDQGNHSQQNEQEEQENSGSDALSSVFTGTTPRLTLPRYSLGYTAPMQVTITKPANADPKNLQMVYGDSFDFKVIGGRGPYKSNVQSGPGKVKTIDGVKGDGQVELLGYTTGLCSGPDATIEPGYPSSCIANRYSFNCMKDREIWLNQKKGQIQSTCASAANGNSGGNQGYGYNYNNYGNSAAIDACVAAEEAKLTAMQSKPTWCGNSYTTFYNQYEYRRHVLPSSSAYNSTWNPYGPGWQYFSYNAAWSFFYEACPANWGYGWNNNGDVDFNCYNQYQVKINVAPEPVPPTAEGYTVIDFTDSKYPASKETVKVKLRPKLLAYSSYQVQYFWGGAAADLNNYLQTMQVIYAGQSYNIYAEGGIPPYKGVITQGYGMVSQDNVKPSSWNYANKGFNPDAQVGVFFANGPASGGYATTVEVQDSWDPPHKSSITFFVLNNNPVNISPGLAVVGENETATFSISGGSGGSYTCSLQNNSSDYLTMNGYNSVTYHAPPVGGVTNANSTPLLKCTDGSTYGTAQIQIKRIVVKDMYGDKSNYSPGQLYSACNAPIQPGTPPTWSFNFECDPGYYIKQVFSNELFCIEGQDAAPGYTPPGNIWAPPGRGQGYSNYTGGNYSSFVVTCNKQTVSCYGALRTMAHYQCYREKATNEP